MIDEKETMVHWVRDLFFSEVNHETLSADLALFGCLVYSLTLPNNGHGASKKYILKDWKTQTPPCCRKWLHELIYIMHMQKLRINNFKFQHRWGKPGGPCCNT